MKELHEKILSRLLAYREEHKDFTFYLRKKGERLDAGYWFLGNENYINIPLFNRGDSNNKTQTIGFVYEQNNDRSFIEIVFNNVLNVDDNEIKFYEELVHFLPKAEQKAAGNRYWYIFSEKDVFENLDYYIKDFRNKCLELIKKYALEDKYIISEHEFNRYLNRINEYRNGQIDLKTENYRVNMLLSSCKIKNIILYGAPGVGKTHNYKNIISMIEDGKSQNEIFDVVSKNQHVDLKNNAFESIKKDGRVEFVTFHQSYSYEDFIEGFRPSEEEDKIVRKDGIFKIISDKARKNLENSQKNIETIQEERKFEELFDLFKDYIEDEIEKNKKFDINETAYITNIEHDAFRYQGDNWGNTQRMKFADIELLYNSNIYERKEIKKVHNISGLAKQHATYFSYFMKHFLEFKKKQKIDIQKIDKIEEKNFYIVIDEINRGNISKIFGELITLIEEDKRDGYEVTLPYSKEKFRVPSNLYIVATMNSTDKSIATIDIALRRRFTFLKMKPNIDLISHVKAKELFHALNIFIKENLNEDYMLGHSYFMNIQNSEDLEFVKEYKIKPLLEEYFYADEENYNKAVGILNQDD
ncbi:AAA family ATPase [Sulfurimonas sp.]|jgi:5-methylcytosine-specific restriction protein B|uniref:McrB family protein n=1 Tax=Sulfurimonas sp. TaxID=2022749 RepID=UPI002A36D784|nr:AAA family ATPase [Sulfurimonas sp.]MDY0123222.1 AAA family ATPase [Sulfurimonas sp.]